MKELEKCIEDYLEYTETHKDSGDNYALGVREGLWDYHNTDDRLKVYCEENSVEVEDIDTLAELVLDNFEMEPENIYGSFTSDFVIAEIPIGEVGVDVNHLITEDMDLEDFPHFIDKYGYAYAVSDIVWTAKISIEKIKDLLCK